MSSMPDDYLDRLDAAFAAMTAARRAPLGPLPALEADRDEVTPGEDDTQAYAADPPITAAVPSPPPAAAIVPDGLVDEITRQVVARLASDEVRRVVLDVAERLVREEIDAIKRARR